MGANEARAGGPRSNAEIGARTKENLADAAKAEREVLRSLLAQQAGKAQSDALLDSERAWETYRDRRCAFEEALFLGGSGAPIAKLECLALETGRRRAELEAFLGPDAAPEAAPAKACDETSPGAPSREALLDGLRQAAAKNDGPAWSGLLSCRFWVGRVASGQVRTLSSASAQAGVLRWMKGLPWESATFEADGGGEVGRFVLQGRAPDEKHELHVQGVNGRWRLGGFATTSEPALKALMAP